MKKIIIAAAVTALLAAASALLIINKNNAASAEAGVETSVVMVLDDFDFSVVAGDNLAQDKRDIIERIDKQNRIEAVLSDLDWVSSADVNIAADDLSVTAVLDVSREPSPDEAEAAAHFITLYVEGLQKEDVVIFDRNNNVIFPVSE